MSLFQAEVVDLDEDGDGEVVCAVRHIGDRDGGCLLVYEANGQLRWRFDTTSDFQCFPSGGAEELGYYGFLAENWDGSPGKELVLASRSTKDPFL